MRAGFLLAALVGFVASAVPTVALAEGPPAPFDFQYVLPENASLGRIPILDGTAQVFELTLDPSSPLTPNQPIIYLELLVTGFEHEAPWDVQLILVPPIAGLAAVIPMNDQGDQVAIPEAGAVDLRFTDKAASMLPTADGVGITSGDYLAQLGTFDEYYNGPVFGDMPWQLLVIDDDPGGVGSIESITLRGVVVPEPATLSLLALGAVAVAVRRRRS